MSCYSHLGFDTNSRHLVKGHPWNISAKFALNNSMEEYFSLLLHDDRHPPNKKKWRHIEFLGLGLWTWCLTSLSIIFQLYFDCQFYWWRKPEFP